MATAPDDFRPVASWEALRLRAGLLAKARAFFDQRGFLEVETPLLSADTVVDRHLDPFVVRLADDPRHPETGPLRYLQTSPEFCMKRLLASGSGPIYQITRAFRRGERGPLHNPEFTMLEWYRPGDDLLRGMQLLSALAAELLHRGPAEELTYQAALQRQLGLDPLTCATAELAQAAVARQVAVPESLSADDRDGWLDLLLSELVQPSLGRAQPTILYHYPASQAALARVLPGPPAVAERFELYVDGIELANGYHELTAAATLSERQHEANHWRQHDGKAPLPEENRLLDAMRSGLPDCCGVALGFDRLAMVASRATRLDQVLAFPIDRA